MMFFWRTYSEHNDFLLSEELFVFYYHWEGLLLGCSLVSYVAATFVLPCLVPKSVFKSTHRGDWGDDGGYVIVMLGLKPAVCTHWEFISYGVSGEQTTTWQVLGVQKQSLCATYSNMKHDVRIVIIFFFLFRLRVSVCCIKLFLVINYRNGVLGVLNLIKFLVWLGVLVALALFADVTLFRWALASALECGFFFLLATVLAVFVIVIYGPW